MRFYGLMVLGVDVPPLRGVPHLFPRSCMFSKLTASENNDLLELGLPCGFSRIRPPGTETS